LVGKDSYNTIKMTRKNFKWKVILKGMITSKELKVEEKFHESVFPLKTKEDQNSNLTKFFSSFEKYNVPKHI